MTDTRDRRVAIAARNVGDRAAMEGAADHDFFRRVYGTPHSAYADRVAGLGLVGLNDVLDAGCGFGQWTLALGMANAAVKCVDVASNRIETVRAMAGELGISNIDCIRASLDALPFARRSFDAVFCYGAVFFVDFHLAFTEFHRVLRPGGRLYFSANDLGWYLHNLIFGHKPSEDFSPRRMARDTLWASARYYTRRRPPAGSELMIPTRVCRAALQRAGFGGIRIGAEGTLRAHGEAVAAPFFRARYLGLRGVYEATAARTIA
jgi:SAM-dependent methyltransferase